MPVLPGSLPALPARHQFAIPNKETGQAVVTFLWYNTENSQRAVIFIKTERRIGILAILLQREKVTAPELAEQFEVSRRTIQRDAETLCRAGIPICTAQGAGAAFSSWRDTG